MIPTTSMRLLLIVTLLLGAALPLEADEPAQSSRVWTAKTGHTQEAELISVDADLRTIDLRLADGRTINMSWRQLSDLDQVWIENHVKANLPVPPTYDIGRFTAYKQIDQYSMPACGQVLLEYHWGDQFESEAAITLMTDDPRTQFASPKEVANVMARLGFVAQATVWNLDEEDFNIFERDYLPAIKEALFRTGPVYVAFRPNILGNDVSGALIVGYDGQRQRFRVYLPGQGVGPFGYEVLSKATTGMVTFKPANRSPLKMETIDKLLEQIVKYENPWELTTQRMAKVVPLERMDCAPWGTFGNSKRMESAAKSQGEVILRILLRAHGAVLVPEYRRNEPQGLYLVTDPDESPDGKWMVWHLSESGWQEGQWMNPSEVIRHWAGPLAIPDNDREPYWGMKISLVQ